LKQLSPLERLATVEEVADDLKRYRDAGLEEVGGLLNFDIPNSEI
jgi:hypothetical protein